MPLKKFLLKPGVNRENTRYTTEGGWYDCDKIRFRQGTPEKIGGWARISGYTFLGICRSLWNWVTLAGISLTGVGTNLKFYVESGTRYYDITPIRDTVTLTDPFTATEGSNIIHVHDVNHGCNDGDFVIYSGGGITGLGGNVTASVLQNEYKITRIDSDNYTIELAVLANALDAAGSPGGGTVVTQYLLNSGAELQTPIAGWGVSTWGAGGWGYGEILNATIRLWSQSNFGEDLIFAPRGGGIYFWDASVGLIDVPVTITVATPGVFTIGTPNKTIPDGTVVQLGTDGSLPTGLTVGNVYYVVGASGNTFSLATTPGGTPIATSGTQSGSHYLLPRAVSLADFPGADANVPVVQSFTMVSDVSRFVMAFGCNDYGTTVQDPMLVRWSEQEDAGQWTPSAINQAGSLRLSHGSQIVTATQTRQEIFVLTDSAAYSIQYLGAPAVWGAQLMNDNISIVGQNGIAASSGMVFWMGTDKFYFYDGRVQTLNCDLRRHVYGDINLNQANQICCGTNEGFNEIWWFYCSKDSTVIDRYVVYNYVEKIWYYGSMGRTAWLDSGTKPLPIAATYSHNLVEHEKGVDDKETSETLPIVSYITSSEFDLDDGHQFSFVWRVLPDITFRGSEIESPNVTMYLYPLKNSGSGYTNPASVGGENSAEVVRTVALPVEEFTGQIFTRVRGRQLAIKIESTDLGVTWQLGAPRLDMRPDGRR